MADKSKWEGKATVTLRGPSADQVWPLWEDFFNLHKYFPGVDTCYKVEPPGQSGLIRYCASKAALATAHGHQDKPILWAHEKLLYSDPDQRCISYEILDNNIGIKSYVATTRVSPTTVAGEGKQPGCRVDWTFVVDPIEGWRLEDLEAHIENNLRLMANNLVESLKPSA